jgi:hypothetical protein
MTKGARRGGKKASADTASDREVSSNHTPSADGKENKQQGNHQQQLAKAQRSNRRQQREVRTQYVLIDEFHSFLKECVNSSRVVYMKLKFIYFFILQRILTLQRRRTSTQIPTPRLT